jgi:integrase
MARIVDRILLTDRKVRSLKPAKPGKRYEKFDAAVPGLAVRVTAKGTRTYTLIARFPNETYTTRLAIGDVRLYSLAEAREIARQWQLLIKQGKDPALEEAKAAYAQAEKDKNTFAAVAEDFIREHVSSLRTSREVERDLRKNFWHWKDRPVTEIKRQDVRSVIKAAVDRGAPHQARNLLAVIRKLFVWTMEGNYGLEHNPCNGISAANLCGKPALRQVILTDTELKAFWLATDSLEYPFRDLFRLLALTGARRDEIAGLRWHEVDFEQKRIYLSPERTKSDAAHVIPLSPTALEILRALKERPDQGELVFTVTGTTPVSGFSKAKIRVQLLGAPKGLRLHDLRRTFRTKLSEFRISYEAKELCLGHALKGLDRVYDQFAFMEERREALERWERHLLGLVNPQPSNVHQLRA